MSAAASQGTDSVPPRGDIPGPGTNTQLQPLAAEQATYDGGSQPDTHTDNMLERAVSTIQPDDTEPSVIIQGSSDENSPEVSGLACISETEMIDITENITNAIQFPEQKDCEHINNKNIIFQPCHSDSPSKTDPKKHCLEIPSLSLKETPPDVEQLRTVVCSVQERL